MHIYASNRDPLHDMWSGDSGWTGDLPQLWNHGHKKRQLCPTRHIKNEERPL